MLYVLYVAYTAYTLYTAYNIIWLAYYSSSYSSTGSILDRAYINQLASYNSSLSSRNIILKASVIGRTYKNILIIIYQLIKERHYVLTKGVAISGVTNAFLRKVY